MIAELENKFKQMGIIIEDRNYFYQLKYWFVFNVEIPVFANVSFNMGDPKINIKTIEDKKVN